MDCCCPNADGDGASASQFNSIWYVTRSSSAAAQAQSTMNNHNQSHKSRTKIVVCVTSIELHCVTLSDVTRLLKINLTLRNIEIQKIDMF